MIGRTAIRSRSVRIWWTLLVVYAVAAIVVLLSPVSPERIVEKLTVLLRDGLGFAVVRQGWIEFGLNVLLFVPLGFLVTGVARRWSVGLFSSVAISVVAELAQIMLPARLPSVRDVIANVLGALIGALIAAHVIRRRAPRTPAQPRQAR